MPQFDLPIDELRAYKPDLPVPDDLDAFWASTLAEARTHDLAAAFEAVDIGLVTIDTFDVTFAGFDGQPIRGWLHLPRGRIGPLPGIVEYVGYGGGRGLAHERLLWPSAGFAYLLMDTRGQGSAWSVGDTPDPDPTGAPFHPGFMSRGVQDPSTYYYRRLFTDAVRAVEALRSHPDVDPTRIGALGGSQGGGMSLAVAALVPDLAAVAPDVPFLSDFPRAITLADTNPYTELMRYLKTHRDHVDAALRTLSYHDVAILGRRAVAPALFSVGLMDDITPPSTVYAAYNWYGGPKEIVEYPFNSHEGGQAFQDRARLGWFARHLAQGA
jgi:cephalosporin-C deacetylase